MNKKILYITLLSIFISCQMFERHTVVEESFVDQGNRDKRKNEKIAKGFEIYKRDCIVCHQKGRKGIDLLKNVRDRMTKQYFSLYITKHDSLRSVNDPYAFKMAREWNNATPKHDYVYTKDEMNYLIEYIMQ